MKEPLNQKQFLKVRTVYNTPIKKKSNDKTCKPCSTDPSSLIINRQQAETCPFDIEMDNLDNTFKEINLKHI